MVGSGASALPGEFRVSRACAAGALPIMINKILALGCWGEIMGEIDQPLVLQPGLSATRPTRRKEQVISPVPCCSDEMPEHPHCLLGGLQVLACRPLELLVLLHVVIVGVNDRCAKVLAWLPMLRRTLFHWGT